jgi:hypothetical protein
LRGEKVRLGVAMLVVVASLLVSDGAFAQHEMTLALAGSLSANDPKDSEGRLDIAQVSLRGDGESRATLKIRTHEPWDCDYYSNESEGLKYQGGRWGSIEWRFLTDGRESYGVFKCDEDGTVIFRVPTDGGAHIEDFRAHKPNGRTVVTTVPFSYFQAHTDSTAYVFTEVSGLRDGELQFDVRDTSPHLQLSDLEDRQRP